MDKQTRKHHAADEQRTKALDPVLSPDAAAAREAMQAAEFTRERLRTVLPRLQKRLREVQEDEVLEQWLPRRNDAAERRDELAEKLREIYVPFVRTILPLMFEIEEVDREIRLVNNAAPQKAINTGGYLLDSVEHAARGPSALQLRHLEIMKDLRLPNWEGAELPVWPPHRPMILTGLTPAMLGDPRLSTGDGGKYRKNKRRPLRSAWDKDQRRAEALKGHAARGGGLNNLRARRISELF